MEFFWKNVSQNSFWKLNQLFQYKQALLDFTRAIHMSPNNHHLWVYRGKVLLLMGRTKEAAAAVEQTSKVADMKQVAIQQQSMIYGFLRDHNKVSLTDANYN